MKVNRGLAKKKERKKVGRGCSRSIGQLRSMGHKKTKERTKVDGGLAKKKERRKVDGGHGRSIG